ncbi:MAG: hypothetical protein SPL80_00700 [Bacilli bacterium]|nr:hypothetical protein [Bacilli bacterium]
MKKSKVIIPAMALLLFSTAASITGTVAWFTSTRTFTTHAGNFAVGSLDGNLDCTLTEGLATDVVADAQSTKNQSISLEANSKLADASYNHANDHLYTDIADSSSYEDLGVWTNTTSFTPPATQTKWFYGDIGSPTATHWYYAATWTMTFTYEFVAEKTDVNLFFNVRAATSTITAGTSTSVADTAQGFRLAFVTGSAGSPANGVVWAPFATQGTWDDDGNNGTPEVPTIRYVSSTSGLGAYTRGAGTGDLLDASDKTNDAYNHAATDTPATTATNYIGTFTKPATPGPISLAVRCTVWFEGTDPKITTRDGIDMQAIKVSLPFYVRNAPAA